MSDPYIFLFDLDGTLIVTDDIYQTIWNTILSEYNIEVTTEIFKTYIQGNSDRNVLIRLLPNKYETLLPTISKFKDKYFLENLSKIRIIDGAIEFIQSIKQSGDGNHKIGIVTNCNRAVAEATLRHIGADPFVDLLVVGSECPKTKPHPDPYLTAIKYFQSTSDKTIIFEDSKVGIQSGRNTFPKCLIGVETIYGPAELKTLDVDFSIKDYTSLDIQMILEYQNDNMEYIKTCIQHSIKTSIANIEFLNYKLKGGFISDVIGMKIQPIVGDHLDCVFKMENKKESFLSKMAHDLQLYDREYYFYDHLYPYVPVKTPQYYGLIKNREFDNMGILMENLANKGFLLNLDLNREKIDVSLKIIERLAQLHAKFWNKNLSKNFKDLKKHSDPIFQPKWGDFIRSKWPVFKQRWSNILPTEKIQHAEYIVEHFQQIQDSLSDRNLTLVHGDVKSANIFYEPREDGSFEPYFIDWQYICEGKGVQDLVFFMIESFDIETMNRYRNIFKEYYYIKLAENGVKDYSAADYDTDFTNSIYYFPFFVAVWFGTIDEDELIDKNFPFFFIQRLFNFYPVSDTRTG